MEDNLKNFSESESTKSNSMEEKEKIKDQNDQKPVKSKPKSRKKADPQIEPDLETNQLLILLAQKCNHCQNKSKPPYLCSQIKNEIQRLIEIKYHYTSPLIDKILIVLCNLKSRDCSYYNCFARRHGLIYPFTTLSLTTLFQRCLPSKKNYW